MKRFTDNWTEVLTLSKDLCKQEFKIPLLSYYSTKIKDLKETLRSRDSEILKQLQLQLIQPLAIHLRTSKNSTNKCILIECLKNVLELTEINDINVFFHLYLLIFAQIFDKDESKHPIPEELKIISLEAGSYLIKNSTNYVLENVYVQESGEKFSVGISVSVTLAKEEKSFQLRKAALDFLLIASQFHRQQEYKSKLYKLVGDLFILYLPGTIASLQEIIFRNETQHHLLTKKALSCWGHILCLTLNDFFFDEELSENEIFKVWMESAEETERVEKKMENIKKALMEKKKNKKWLAAATNILEPLICKVTEIRKHPNPKCRLELVKVIMMLLENCAINLEAFFPAVMEALIGCCFDDNEEVSFAAKEGFRKLEMKFGERSFKIYNNIIENNLFLLLNKLPRLMVTKNKEMLLLLLKSFSGHLRILGKNGRLKQLLCFSTSLKKLMIALQISFKLKICPELSDQEFTVWDNDYNSKTCLKSWKHFQFFEDSVIKQELEEICKLLGLYGDLETLFDCLLDSYNRDYKSKKEILIILNQVILGVHKMENHMINRLIDFYIDSENFCLSTEINGKDCVNLKEARCNIIMIALTLEGIGNLAENLQCHIQNHLLKILYCVVEHIGNIFSAIRTEALKTALVISKACGFSENICFLLRNNMDYLIYHLTIKLRKNDSKALDVMTVLIKNSSFETLYNLEDLVYSVLQNNSKNFDCLLTLSYLRLLHTFVSCIRKQIQPLEINSEVPITKRNEIDELNIYLKDRKKAEETMEKEENENVVLKPNKEKNMEMEEKNSKVPRYILSVVSVSNHCLHFLASKDKTMNIIVLETLNECVFILAEWENYVLPIVHKIWSPLSTKFEQMTDPLIINRSFMLLCTLAQASKDFIRSRTLKNILPRLLSFMWKEAHHSKLKTTSTGYYFCQNYKLQSELLKNIGLLAINLGLCEKDLDLLVENLLIYLDSLQPKELQELCVTLFFHLKTYDSYIVWLKLDSLLDDLEYIKNKNIILNICSKS